MFVVLNNMKLYAYVTKGPPDPLRAHIFQDSALRLHQISYLLCAYCDVSFAHDNVFLCLFRPVDVHGSRPRIYDVPLVKRPGSCKRQGRSAKALAHTDDRSIAVVTRGADYTRGVYGVRRPDRPNALNLAKQPIEPKG